MKSFWPIVTLVSFAIFVLSCKGQDNYVPEDEGQNNEQSPYGDDQGEYDQSYAPTNEPDYSSASKENIPNSYKSEDEGQIYGQPPHGNDLGNQEQYGKNDIPSYAPTTAESDYSSSPKGNTYVLPHNIKGPHDCKCFDCSGHIMKGKTCNCLTCEDSVIGIQLLEPKTYDMLWLVAVNEAALSTYLEQENCTSVGKGGDCACTVFYFTKGRGFKYLHNQRKKKTQVFHWAAEEKAYQQCGRTQEYCSRKYTYDLTLNEDLKIPKEPKLNRMKVPLSPKKLIASNGNMYIYYDCAAANPSFLFVSTNFVPKEKLKDALKEADNLIKISNYNEGEVKWHPVYQYEQCVQPTQSFFRQIVELE